jgi:hypothetical protein
MRIIWIVLLLLSSPAWLFSQSREIEFFQSFDSVQTTDALASVQGKTKFVKKYSEWLNLGIEHTSWFIYKGRKGIKTQLLTLSVNGKIFYREFFDSKLNQDFDGYEFEKLYAHLDDDELNRLNSYALKTLGNEINLKHIERHQQSTFGYACYVSASMPHEGESMLGFVAKNDTTNLIDWLRSVNPVKQTYAYLGLKLLQSRTGIQLTNDIKECLRKVESSEASIFTCSGCTTWEYSQIKNLLTKEDVDQFIERTKRFGLPFSIRQ